MFGLQIGRMGLPSGRPPFDPRRTFFSLAEQGVWYDPSDLSTLYQDSAGTTPVTAAEQPVGLMLDKSKGLVLGPELVTNGGFDSNVNGWTRIGGGVVPTWLNGELQANGAGLGTGCMGPNMALIFGVTYEISFDVRGATSYAGMQFGLRRASAAGSWISSSGGSVVGISTTMARATLRLTVTGSASDAVFFARFSGNEQIFLDNISVRELPGNHRFQSTATARPLYQSGPHRLDFDGIDDVHSVNFPASLGSNCTIARAVPGVGASILTGQTIGTSLAITQSDAGLIIVNRPFTASETASVTAYLNARAFA